MKKTIFSLFIFAVLSFSSFGQAPEGFNYQAVVRDAGNTILNNQTVGMRMTIQQGSIGGTAVYAETFTTTTNAYGLVNLQIGLGTSIDDFSTIDWSAGPYFMETAVDLTGGTSYAVMGTNQLMSVPYALYAKTSGSGDGPVGAIGQIGNTGLDGPQGAVGLSGAIGPIGLSGTQGSQGLTGGQGLNGLNGPQGIQGPQGLTGAAGLQGFAGIMGLQGPQGLTGQQGGLGATGAIGLPGPIGAQGFAGAMGAQGQQGNAGPIGLTGNNAYQAAVINGYIGTEAQWLISLHGAQGTQGTQGTQGPMGQTGIVGLQGPIGEVGMLGPIGNSGPAGLPGQTGSIGSVGNSGTEYTGNCSYSIGESVGALGGIIFYLDPTGCHGLVCSPDDISISSIWGTSTYVLPAFESSIGGGYYNTCLYGVSTNSTALGACLLSQEGGKLDWYLPSSYELFLMLQNIGPGNSYGGLNLIPGFLQNVFYWSSTEIDNSNALALRCPTGNITERNKSLTFYVRAIRMF